jgi:hypothetical protein
MKQNILWIIVILLAAVSQWYIIEIKKRNPDHAFWFMIRGIVFSGFFWWYMVSDFMWYWASFYMVMTFAWLFPLLLNAFRKKPLGYMSDRGFDRLIQKTIGAGIYFYLGFVLMVTAIGLQLAYGMTPFNLI